MLIRCLRSSTTCFAVILLGASACDPATPDATLSLGYTARGAYSDPVNFRAQVSQPGSVRMIEGTDLTAGQHTSEYFSGSLDKLALDAGKPASVQISLISVSALPIEFTYSWRPEKEMQYGLQAVVDTRRPLGLCVHVLSAQPLPTRAATVGDTLFVLQSALPRNAVC